MNLFDYIKSQLPSMPNVAIMKDMGASDELVEYIRKTPWNTNTAMLAAYGCEPSGGSEPTREVWAYADGTEIEAEIEEDGSISGETLVQRDFSAWKDLFDNSQNYEIEVKSGEKVASLAKTSEEEWGVSQDGLTASITKDSSYVGIYAHNDGASRIEIIVTKK